TGEKSKKLHKQTADEESTATALALAGNSTPALTNKHHRSAVSPRVRGFGPLHNKRTHRQQPPWTMDEEKRHRHRLQLNPTATRYGHSPAAGAQRTRSELSKSHTRNRILIHP
ncbi:hypothetical protein TcG_03515, partial [Trypanosoma cruzi]